ncbi:hypothetical protein SAMN05443668_110153 [Cryptosporangium aurantiacum]|uniref:Uncharacterized protein n=1 Tax=Cryptosporangium aurantiacum TaxID=134849 RepID=A0A1M7RDK4_9ACTN|nr:hypothetical protein SAMN05443668_110153 [Cryptosporangium aurantiacum]
MAQPPLDPAGELVLDRPDGAYSAVEEAVRLALQAAKLCPKTGRTSAS